MEEQVYNKLMSIAEQDSDVSLLLLMLEGSATNIIHLHDLLATLMRDINQVDTIKQSWAGLLEI